MWALSRTAADFGQYIDTEQALAASVNEMYAQGLQGGQALRNIVLDPGTAQAYKNLDASREQFDKAYQAAQVIASGTDKAAAVQKLKGLRDAQLVQVERVRDLAKTDSAMARELLNSEETPAWRKLREQLLDFKTQSGRDAEATRESVLSWARWAWLISASLAALALVSAVLGGVALQRILRREVGGDPAAARDVLKRVADGDLTGHIPPAQADESLMAALVTMQDTMRSLVSKIHTATDSIQVASTEIAMGNQDLSSRTEQTASNLEETAASMEQLTSTVRNSADAARQANQLAATAAQIASRGGEVVSQVVSTMDEINHSSKKINDIIGVIDGIAFQTNILALNAAVEAARAGEQGRGFAVVAGEVRNLAQRSAQAAKEIKGLIGASVERVEAGSRLVADAGQTMSEIVGSVQRVSDIIGEITAAAGEQSDGIAQVNTAVSQLDQMTQQNAALVEQSAAAAQSLREQAARLAETVQVFQLGAHRA